MKKIKFLTAALLSAIIAVQPAVVAFAETDAFSSYNYSSKQTLLYAPPAYQILDLINPSNIEGVTSPLRSASALEVNAATHRVYVLDSGWVASATAVTEPDTTEPDATEPDATEPDATEPDATEPDATEPDAAEPDATEPDTTEPDAAEPDAAEPDTTEPDATEPDATEPDATEPDAAEPDATEPDATEPDTTEPASGKGRLLIFEYDPANIVDWTYIGEITTYEYNGVTRGFNAPEGLFVSDEGDIYVCDTDNHVIVQFNQNHETVRVIEAPTSDLFDADFVYLPSKLVLDTTGRFYVISEGVTSGIIELDREGNFTSFLGAAKVRYSWFDVLINFFLTAEQKARRTTYVPSEYNNIEINEENHLFVTNGTMSEYEGLTYLKTANNADDRYATVKKLNPSGKDIMYRTAWFSPGGDLKIENYGDLAGTSVITDVSVQDQGIFSILDRKRGRVFTYDASGYLLYIFGGLGNREGSCKDPIALENIGDDLLILDGKNSCISVFECTEYATKIKNAIYLQQDISGREVEAKAAWEEVLKLNANFELAYIGIGRVLYNIEKDYVGAMKMFKLGDNKTYFSQAWKQYRRELIDANFGLIFTLLIVLIVVWQVTKVLLRRRKKKKAMIASASVGKEV